MGSPTGDLSDPELRWSQGLRAATLGWVAARIAVAAGFALAHGLSGVVHLPDGRLHLDEGLMTWDGTFYRVITQGWYSSASTAEDPARFFPGYPALGRVVEPLVFGNTDLALLLIANVAALAAGVLVWRLAAEAIGDSRVAVRAAWMVAIIPAANVMVFAYTESLMLLLVAAGLLALHRRRPGWAAMAGLAAGALRPSGVLMGVPAAIEAWQWYRNTGQRRLSEIIAWSGAVIAPAVGLAGALWVVSRPEGDLLASYRIQRQLRDGFRDPLTRLAQAGVDFAQGHFHDLYNVAFAVGFAVLFVVAVRRRQPLSWLGLMAITWVVAVGANNMDSVGRYCLVAAPFTIALAQWAGSRGRQWTVGILGCAGTDLVHQRGAAGPDHPLTYGPRRSRGPEPSTITGRRPRLSWGRSERPGRTPRPRRSHVAQEYPPVALEVHELLGQQEDPPVEVRVVHAVGLCCGTDPALFTESPVDRPQRQRLGLEALGLGHLLLGRIQQIGERHLAERLGEHRTRAALHERLESVRRPCPAAPPEPVRRSAAWRRASAGQASSSPSAASMSRRKNWWVSGSSRPTIPQSMTPTRPSGSNSRLPAWTSPWKVPHRMAVRRNPFMTSFTTGAGS